jgi:hypothetical protein
MSGCGEVRAEDNHLTTALMASEVAEGEAGGGGGEEGVLVTKNGKKYKKLRVRVTLEGKNGCGGRHVASRPTHTRHVDTWGVA